MPERSAEPSASVTPHRTLDWRNPEHYAYTTTLTSEAWAWEFLRRSPLYKTAWNDANHGRDPDEASIMLARPFGLLRLEDPALTALEAKPLWLPDVSSFVLPLHVNERRDCCRGYSIEASQLRAKSVAQSIVGVVQHLLFVEEGRRLQLALHATGLSGPVHFMTD